MSPILCSRRKPAFCGRGGMGKLHTIHLKLIRVSMSSRLTSRRSGPVEPTPLRARQQTSSGRPNRLLCATAAVRTLLLDHLVGAGEQRGWDFQAKRPRSFEVDHEFELG